MKTCAECGNKKMKTVEGTHDFDFGLDSKVRVTGVTIYTCEKCGAEAIKIPHMSKMASVIAVSVAQSSERLTAKELTFLRKHLQLTQTQLGEKLGGIEQETISRWEHGAQAIGSTAEQLLRLLVVLDVNGHSSDASTLPIKPVPTSQAHPPLQLALADGSPRRVKHSTSC